MQNFNLNLLFFFFALCLSGPTVMANDDDTMDALQKTQSLLNNSKDRNEFIQKNRKAKEADDFALKAAGGDTAKKSEIYSISSEVFTELVKANNGDMSKVQQQLLEALKNPEAFSKLLSPELRQKIRAVSSESNSKTSTP